jgi:hypothetical protein
MRFLSRPPVLARAFIASLALTAIGTATTTTALAERKPPSACVGLEESVCASKQACYWRKATSLKNGKVRRAHCRIKRSASKKSPPT